MDLAAEQRRRAEALVVLRIFLVADAQIFLVEEADDGGHDLFLAERALLEVLVDLTPDLRQRFAELGRPENLLASALARKSGW